MKIDKMYLISLIWLKIFEEFSQIDTQLEPEESIESDADEDDELELTVEPVNDQFDDYQYDYTDILPPFCKFFQLDEKSQQHSIFFSNN